MRRKTTKEILAESFREIAEKKDIDKITIKDIADNCGYSVATFYRQFKDKYDLIAWDYSNRVSQMIGQVGKNGYTWQQTLSDGLTQYQKEKEYLTNLLEHTGGHDSFIKYMAEIHCRKLSSYVNQLIGTETLDKQTELLIRLYCLGTATLNCEWILGKIDADAAELAKIYEKFLPEPLKQILMEK